MPRDVSSDFSVLRSGGIIGISFLFFLNMTVYCVFIRIASSSQICSYEIFQGIQERVRISHGKRAISVRATDDLLYYINQQRIQSNTVLGLFSPNAGLILFHKAI